MSTDKKPEEVKVAPDPIREMMRAMIMEAMPAMVAAIVAAQKPLEVPLPVKPEIQHKPQCAQCKQPQMACAGKHEMVKCLPNSEDYFEYWQGIIINGIRYSSPDNGAPVCVPADANVANMIVLWEQQERMQKFGYKKKRNVTPGLASTV